MQIIETAEMRSFRLAMQDTLRQQAETILSMQDGIEATWTGQGRMPKALAEQVKAGKALEDFLL